MSQGKGDRKGKDPRQKLTRGDRCAIERDDWITTIKPDGTTSNTGRGDTGREVFILGSYADLYGGKPQSVDYSIMYADSGSTMSWMPEQHLRYIDHAGEAGIITAIAEREAREVQEKDPAWIVAHWGEQRASGATCEALMALCGITNPWGRNGEGFVWYENWQRTELLLRPALVFKRLDWLHELADIVTCEDGAAYEAWRKAHPEVDA